MAIRNIVQNGDDILLKKSRTIVTIDERILQLLDDMAQTMYEKEGCGLAAVQVGVLKRVVVIDCGDGLIELINPEIVDSKGIQENSEGCLSIPGEFGITSRPAVVKVKALNRKGKVIKVVGQELLARALCHEIDHLDGILFTSRVIRKCKEDE